MEEKYSIYATTAPCTYWKIKEINSAEDCKLHEGKIPLCLDYNLFLTAWHRV